MIEPELLPDHAAERQTSKMALLDAQLVPDCDHIARKLCKAEASPRSKAGTVAARIRSKDLVLVRKIADEPVPHRGTPGNRMAERQPGDRKSTRLNSSP